MVGIGDGDLFVCVVCSYGCKIIAFCDPVMGCTRFRHPTMQSANLSKPGVLHISLWAVAIPCGNVCMYMEHESVSVGMHIG